MIDFEHSIAGFSLPGYMVMPLAPFIGSWLGVLVRRLPEGQPVVLCRSNCENCGHTLHSAELLPLVSFILQAGRCRHCGAWVGWFYPAIELAALAIAAAAFYADGDGSRVWIDAGLGWSLLCAAWIDAETFRLLDSITLPLLLAGLAVTWLEQSEAIYNHAAAAALGYCGLRLLNWIYFALRGRQGVGEGDAKLLAAAGAWLGAAALHNVLLVSALIGICQVIVNRQSSGPHGAQVIAFGPALALGFFLWRLFGYHIMLFLS